MGVNDSDRTTMENLFWHYVKGQTKMFTNKTFAAETTWDRNRLESLMAKIGWNEKTTFPELVKQFSLLSCVNSSKSSKSIRTHSIL